MSLSDCALANGQAPGGRWHSTRDTACVLYALADYLQITGEVPADLAAVVELNAERLVVRQFTADDVFKPELAVDMPAELLEEAELTLSLAASELITVVLITLVNASDSQMCRALTGQECCAQRCLAR